MSKQEFVEKPISVMIISFDWDNLYKYNPEAIETKLIRDGFRTTIDSFFTISWSTETYYKKINDNFETYHMKARFRHLRPLYDVLLLFKLLFILERFKVRPDIVIAYDFPNAASLLLAKLFYKFKTVLFVTNLPTQLIKTRKKVILRNLYQRVSEFFAKFVTDYVFCINETTKEYVHKIGIPDTKIRVFVSNTIKQDKHIIETTKKGVYRNILCLSSDKKMLISVGRLEPEKGMEELIDAFIKINDDRLVLCIAGEGFLKQKLENKIKEKKFDKKIFLLGHLKKKQLWSLYTDADLFILLSKSEALGLVFWEAMYMSVPVIGSRVGGIIENIGANEERGFYWQPGDSLEQLKDRINELLFLEYKKLDKERLLHDARQYVIEKIENISTMNSML